MLRARPLKPPTAATRQMTRPAGPRHVQPDPDKGRAYPPRIRRGIDIVMRGLIPVALAAFAVLVAGFLYMALHDDSGPLVNSDDTSLTGMVAWSVAAGVAALAFGIVCLRSELFMTLACIIAVCFSVLLVGFGVLFQLKAPGELNSLAPRAIEAWQPLLFLFIAGSLAWCLQEIERGHHC